MVNGILICCLGETICLRLLVFCNLEMIGCEWLRVWANPAFAAY